MLAMISLSLFLLTLHILVSPTLSSSSFTDPSSLSTSSQPAALVYISLGDSYAAGDGAGSSWLLPPRFDVLCARFDGAYPVQIAANTSLPISDATFQQRACGGATTTTVLLVQAPSLGAADVVTLTVGGNEADFFAVLNECVQQWRPRASCAAELRRARELVQSGVFIQRYDEMVRELLRKLDGHGRLFLTGYARFFNAETQACNRVSFSKTDPTNYLTNGLRRGLNDLVMLINDVVEGAATARGAEFVDVDAVFEGHRFCEEGVKEPVFGREETWFFNLEYEDSQYATIESGRVQQGLLPRPIDEFLQLTQVFHPTSAGHAAIADEIVRLILRK